MSQRGFVQVMQEKLAELAPSLKGAMAEMGMELERLGNHGRTELAAALFGGNGGFVLYGADQRAGKAEANKGIHGPELQKPEPDQGQERERGGREM
jgi:hypothetical protein